MRTTKEIASMMAKAQAWSNSGETTAGGMTYEEGVECALRWVLGEADEPPIETEYKEPEEEED